MSSPGPGPVAMASLDTVESDWREIMASKASKWNRGSRSRRLSHLTISTHSPSQRTRSPIDEMDDADGEESIWSETESTVSTGFSRSVRSRATTLSVYSGMSCDSQDDLDAASVITADEDDDVSTASEVPEPLFYPHPATSPAAPATKWVEDDLGLRSFPTKHVDYLSHDWREVDIWASWRHLMSKKSSYNNEKRLENACWRVWGKKRYDLKTVSPGSLNWLKDCDVTWLYGPLQPGPVDSLKSLALYELPSQNSPLRQDRDDVLDLKPILKRRSVSEKMLVRSLLSASLLKQATAAVEAERSSRSRTVPIRPLIADTYIPRSVRPTSPVALSRSPSTASLRPLLTRGAPDKKRIHFQEQVDQCIALENSDSESDSRGMMSEYESDSEGGVSLARGLLSIRKAQNLRRLSRSAERRSRIIAKLPSTTLNHSDEDENMDLAASFWRRSKSSPPPSPSPEVLSPILAVTDFSLDDEADERSMSWTLDRNFESDMETFNTAIPDLDRALQTAEDLPFPCLVCNGMPDHVYPNRNEWLVHLWAVHQHPSTWATSRCLLEGCHDQQAFESAWTWLIHVREVHDQDMNSRREDGKTLKRKLSFQPEDIAVYKLAKDIGSIVVHTAGDPLAAIVDKLRRQSKATPPSKELSSDESSSTIDATHSDDTEYLREMVEDNIRKMSLDDDGPANMAEQVRVEASLVSRLVQLLSLRGSNSKVNTENDGEDTLLTAEHECNSNPAQSLALYSIPSGIHDSLLYWKPLPDLPYRDQDNLANSQIMDGDCADDHDAGSEETTEYDSSDLEDSHSDASAYGESSEFFDDHRSAEERLGPILEPMQQALVDRVMDEFWVIFNQNWDSGARQHTGHSQNTASPSSTNVTASTVNTPQSTQPQRKRQRDDKGSDDEDGNMSRKPKRSTGPSDESGDRKSFACPFRKHDSRRYSTYAYRVCALSHWETIARVKEHIYRCHRMPVHCKRCWKQFKNQEQLDTHLTVDITAMCELKNGTAPDGITTEQERRLRSRKKTSPNQSDEGRWREIYQVLFPNEEIPSPYFEAVHDEIPPGSPDSRDLANYEDYMRRELPRLVRTNIEDVVRRDMQPLEAALIGNLVGIIQDCQDRLFRGYRQSRGEGTQASASPDVPSLSFASTASDAQTSPSLGVVEHEHQQSNLLQAAFQYPPLSNLDIPQQDMSMNMNTLQHQRSLDMILSDSGYASEMPHFCECTGPCSCGVNSFNAYMRDCPVVANEALPFEEGGLGGVDMQWDGWDPFPSWDAVNEGGGGYHD